MFAQMELVPNLKLSTALTNLHVSMHVFHGEGTIISWAPDTGGVIRMMAKHFRDIACDDEKKAKCLAKAWGLQPKRK